LNRCHSFGFFAGQPSRRFDIGLKIESQRARGHVSQLSRPHALWIGIIPAGSREQQQDQTDQ
jgi:hypothetical protein